MEASVVACLEDNYTYILAFGDRVVIVDPSEAEPIFAALNGRRVDEIWLTHHHWDHVHALPALRQRFPRAIVRSSAHDRERIAGVTHTDERFDVGGAMVHALRTPGHTLGAVSYVVAGMAFTGDTLFRAGCGRLFEGTAQMLFASLQAIAALPASTRIYCGHEYTIANLRFAASVGLSVEPELRAAEQRRREGAPTVPSSVADELRINPFVRARDASELATLRARKDVFNA